MCKVYQCTSWFYTLISILFPPFRRKDTTSALRQKQTHLTSAPCGPSRHQKSLVSAMLREVTDLERFNKCQMGILSRRYMFLKIYMFLIVRGCRVGDFFKNDLPWWKSSLSLKMKPLLWNILQYACWRCQGKIMSLWNLTTISVFGWFWEIIMGYVLATICQICDLPLINTVHGTNPANQLSLALYLSIYHGF